MSRNHRYWEKRLHADDLTYLRKRLPRKSSGLETIHIAYFSIAVLAVTLLFLLCKIFF